jgi:hypothetical protein
MIKRRRFNSLQDIHDERIKLQRFRVNHEERLRMLSGELTKPKSLIKLLKNSLLSSMGLGEGSEKPGNTSLSSGLVSIIGMLLGAKLMTTSGGKYSKYVITFLPMILPSRAFLDRFVSELRVSYERFQEFRNRKEETKV